MDTKAIQFSINELLLLERVISYNAPRTVLGVPPITDDDLVKMALQIGQALISAKEDEPIELALTLKDCWLFREVISVFDRVGKSEVAEGFSIKSKLYEAILEFNLAAHVTDVPQLGLPEAMEVTYASQSDDPG
jgi:hypothetical protein